jgi:hypothetical protein
MEGRFAIDDISPVQLRPPRSATKPIDVDGTVKANLSTLNICSTSQHSPLGEDKL